MTWGDFSTTAGQLGILVALTGLLYRLGRLWWPDIPEAVIQFIAAILASVSNCAILYTPEIPKYKWLLLGIASGIMLSQNVVKSIDWIAAAATKTGAPDMGIPERPPQWYVDLHPELFPQTTAKTAPPPAVPDRTFAQLTAKARAQAEKDAVPTVPVPVTPARVDPVPVMPPPAVLVPIPPPARVPRERDA